MKKRMVSLLLALSVCAGLTVPATAAETAETAEKPAAPFADVAQDAYCYDAVLWTVEKGITTGKTETTFAPDELCTRGHIVTFLYRAAFAAGEEQVSA